MNEDADFEDFLVFGCNVIHHLLCVVHFGFQIIAHSYAGRHVSLACFGNGIVFFLVHIGKFFLNFLDGFCLVHSVNMHCDDVVKRKFGQHREQTVLHFRCYAPQIHCLADFIAKLIAVTMAHRVVCGIGGAVDDGIGTVALALDAVGVVPTRGLVFAGHDVPLVDFILDVTCNLVAGLAVGFFDVDLQRPLGIAHLVGIVGVGRHCNGLVAAVAAPVGFKTEGNGDFVITELQRCKLCLRAGNSIIYSALCFCLNGGNRRIALAVGGCVRSFFRSIGADAATAAIYGLGYSVMHGPTGRCSTAAILVIVVVGVTACGNSLHTGRGNAPAAAVNRAGFGDRLDFNRGTVYLFQRFQLDLICGDTIGQIHGAAGGLCRGFPTGIILLYDRLRLFRFLLTDFRANQGNGLPTAARRGINVGVVAAGLCIGNSAIQQGLRGFQIDFCSSARGIIFNQPHLGIVVNRAAEIQKRDFFSIFCGKSDGRIGQKFHRELVQTAPDAVLVAVVVTGNALIRTDQRSVRISVRRTAFGLAVGTVGAAVGFLAIEPDQPCAVDLLDLGDFTAGNGRRGTLGIGGNVCDFCERCGHGAAAVNYNVQHFRQRAAIRGSVDKLCGKVGICLYIQTHNRGGRFGILTMHKAAACSFIGGDAVEVQHGHLVGKHHIQTAAVCRVFYLCQNGCNGIVGPLQQRSYHRQVVAVQGVRTQVTVCAFFQLVIRPGRNTDFCFTCGNRQALAAHIGTSRRIR